MHSPGGYANHHNQGSQGKVEQDAERCGNCDYYKEARSKQRANGFTHLVGVCAYEVFIAKTHEQLRKAELVETSPSEEPCQDYRRTR